MTTVFCRHCGQTIHHAALVCPHCGSAQISTAPGDIITPAINFPGMSPEMLHTWGDRFRLIRKAGGPNLSKLPLLTRRESISVLFNGWALLLGPVYFVRLGMWRRAVAVLVVCLLVAGVISLLTGALMPVGGYCAISLAAFTWRANRDYYRKVVLGDNGWW